MVRVKWCRLAPELVLRPKLPSYATTLNPIRAFATVATPLVETPGAPAFDRGRLLVRYSFGAIAHSTTYNPRSDLSIESLNVLWLEDAGDRA
jgi:hypothetical protein